MNSYKEALVPVWHKFSRESWYKVLRPEQCVIAGAAALALAIALVQSTLPLATGVFCALTAAFSCCGASLFHYGIRADTYAEKVFDPVVVHEPQFLMQLGSLAFAASIGISFALPVVGANVALANYVIIVLYGLVLDRVWPFKNLVAAAVCVSPIIIGWAASGGNVHVLFGLLAPAYLVYIGREVIKDVNDVQADMALRFTLIMWIGERRTMQIAGLVLLLGAALLFSAVRNGTTVTAGILGGLGCVSLGYAALRCFLKRSQSFAYRSIDIGVSLYIVSLLATRAGLP